MKLYLITLLFGIILALNAQTLDDILRCIDKSPAIKSADMAIDATYENALSKEGLNMPSIDIYLKAMHLKDTPTMTLNLPAIPIPTSPLPTATKDRFEGEISISYPIFTGFAITSQIHLSQLEVEKAKLKQKDLKRNLYLKAITLFGSIKSINSAIKSQKEAKRATKAALKKAQGFYSHGLIAPSELYNIKAKLYEIESILAQSYSKREKLLNTLSYLTNTPIKHIDGSIDINLPSLKKLKAIAHKNRADILVLKKILDINDEQIKLAKSTLYPQIAIKAALKRDGDSLSLNGDGYTNADNSYIAMGINYNLYSGGKDIHRIESARYLKLSNQSKLIDYIHRVDSQIDNAYSDLKALRYRLKSATMQLKAQREYYRLTLGRFENQMASADELSRAIASLANIKAQRETILYSIKVQKAKIRLLGGLQIR